MPENISDKTAVVGVGTSAFARDTGKDILALIGDAFVNALADSGLKKTDIDGLIVNMGPNSDQLPQMLGIEVEYGFETWQHGRLSGPSVGLAAMAVNAGLAECILC